MRTSRWVLGGGLLGLSLVCVSCSAGPGADGNADPSAAPPTATSPEPGPAGQDCTRLLNPRDVRAAVGKPVQRDSITSKPPKSCGYSVSGGGLVALRYLPVFPVGQGVATRFEGHPALLADDSTTQPAKCSLYVRLGDGPDTIAVNVHQVPGPDVCGVTKQLARTALSRLPTS